MPSENGGYPTSPCGRKESCSPPKTLEEPEASPSAASIRDESAVCAAMLRLLREESELCDFTFIVGEQRERLPAVRAVLAVRSPPLRSMLYDPSFRMAQREAELPQWTPRAFRVFLEFLHAGIAEVDAETVLELMRLAHYWQVEDLMEYCTAFLSEHMSPDTVTTLLSEAVRFDDDSLRDRCKEFLLANACLGPLRSPAFSTLPEWLVCELLSDSSLNADEWDVYEAVKAWIAVRRMRGGEPERTCGGGEKSPPPGAAPQAPPAGGKKTEGRSDDSDEELILEHSDDDAPEVATCGARRGATDMSPASSLGEFGVFAGMLGCVRLGLLSVDQLQAMRRDGLISESRMLDAVLRKLDGGEATEVRRRTLYFDFEFDSSTKGDGVSVSSDGQAATFTRDNCVLGETMLPQVGQAYWEVAVCSGTNAYIGIARRERIDVQRNMGSGGGIAFRGIGGHEKWKECSHDEYGQRLSAGDRVGVLVDLPAKSLSFYLNGEPLGLAFSDLDPTKRYWPCVSNNAGEMRIVQSRRIPA